MEKKKALTPLSRNPHTPCSNVDISQTTGRNLVWILSDESTHQVLSNGVFINKIRPVVSEISPFKHGVSGFLEGGVRTFFFSTPHIIFLVFSVVIGGL